MQGPYFIDMNSVWRGLPSGNQHGCGLPQPCLLDVRIARGREPLNLVGAERDVLRVIADQHGAPTSAVDLAGAILDVAHRVQSDGDASPWGTYHLTGAGQTTWYGLAEEIFRLSAQAGHKVPKLDAITTAEYPLPAVRPPYCVLDTAKIRAAFGITLPPWQQSLAACVRQLQARDYP